MIFSIMWAWYLISHNEGKTEMQDAVEQDAVETTLT
jgi:hypothetical protein